ncbi:primosomal protein N' [Paeniglutamicibacter cryotolerans]|uniref:Probable replication restart protein PriA n=1 Tax=Paeniglutamicibacter cryotolerans TaxID=670079 RepID=A0A839QN13_9MICC|nr:primosomal protein N' [Paeniglutamicibacter cryotolerans]MBB2997160.1 primosomal protein N' (replication factor Y) [Paeniglutamicibacter cryotolerans]
MDTEPRQPSLLAGFDISGPAPGIPHAAAHLPVARVAIESAVPHLDRDFDYLVPAALDADAQPGVRVKVRFGGQELTGFLLERRETSEAGVKLQPLAKVVSSEPVLTPHVLSLARAVAARYAGTLCDVLRAAIPPRMARVEFEARALEAPAEAGAGAAEPGEHLSVPTELLQKYDGGAEFALALAAGQSPRAVLGVIPNQPGGWPALLAEVVAETRASGRGALVVVPDARDLNRLCAALDTAIGQENYARLSADDGATPRYRNFLRLARGEVDIAVGTRNAAFAPVRNLGAAIMWEDHDSSHAEPRAPYQHAREVLLLRAGAEGCALLLASHGRSAEAQRLVRTGWARELGAPRPVLRQKAARVVSSSDSFERERDPVLHAARLPAVAWKAASEALRHGPVLVQVARTGFLPALRCERCRESARCTECNGPLGYRDAHSTPSCQWCGRHAPGWGCPTCGGTRLRAATIGADRTAEELGRAFPQVPVVSATGANPRVSVGPEPALVVATPGAEPYAEGGYAAVLLLDGDRMLARDGLRTGEELLHRWMAAAALARGHENGGVVVVAAGESDPLRALLRWDPASFAERELVLRHGLHLPPAVRTALIQGPAVAADKLANSLALPEEAKLHGPVPEAETDHRWLLFYPYAQGNAVTAELRRARMVASAAREPVVRIRVDPDGIL